MMDTESQASNLFASIQHTPTLNLLKQACSGHRALVLRTYQTSFRVRVMVLCCRKLLIRRLRRTVYLTALH